MRGRNDEVQGLYRDDSDYLLVLLAFGDVAGRSDHHPKGTEDRLDDDLVGWRVLGIVVVGLSLHILARSEHETRVLRHQGDRNVEQEISLAQIVLRGGLPVEPVVVVLGHAKSPAYAELLGSYGNGRTVTYTA